MRIAIDARLYGLDHAGIGRYTQNLIAELAKTDHRNHYFLFVRDPRSIDKLPKNFTPIKANINHYTLAEQTSFLSLLNRHQFDLIHFTHFNVPLFFQRPFIVTIHDLLWHEKIGLSATTLNPAKYLIKYLGYRLVVRNAVTRSRHIITPTTAVKSNIHQHFGTDLDKISVTYEAADRVYSHPDPAPKTLLEKYHLTTPFIIYTGSLYPHKNVDTLIKSLHHLPHINLAIVSARNIFHDRTKHLVASLGLSERVTFTGFVPDSDLASLYTKALALVQPSQSEGFGLTGIEAMATGLPVVCSPNSVMKEVYGTSALYTNTSNSQRLAASISKLANTPSLRQKYATRGRRQASVYSWDQLARDTLAIYQQHAPHTS